MTSIWRKLQWEYVRNNRESVLFTMGYLFIVLSFGLARFFLYLEVNPFLATARACGQMLNITISCSLFLVCRNLITCLFRSFGLARYLPLDHYIYFHKLTGWLIALFSLLHTVAHVCNMWIISKTTTIPYLMLLFSPNLRIGWICGLASLTGWLLCIVLVIMLVFSMNFIRRRGCFEIFYYTHLLYIVFYVAAFVHAPKFIHCFAAPLCLFLIERGLRYYRSHGRHHGRTYVMEGSLLPSRVIRLVIKKPQNFKFNAGDFVYVMVPWITKREWHPITISSAPEDELITLHIRAVGEWTNRLYDHFDRAQTTSIKDFIRNWQDPSTSNMTALSPKPYVSVDIDSTRPPRSFGARVEAIKNDQLATRTLILPIPDDCDENGCPSKKWLLNTHDKKETTSKEDLDGFELVPLGSSNGTSNNNPYMLSNENNNNNNGYSCSNINTCETATKNAYEESSVPLIKTLKSLVSVGHENAVILNEPLKIRMDGPFGAPSSNIFQTEHAVLISTGIGVTPFTSILQSIMYRYTEQKKCCPNCSHTWTEKILSRSVMNLRKVDFVWINRDHSSFEWFVEKLEHLVQQQLSVPGAKQQSERFLDIFLYVTGKMQGSINCQSLNWSSGRPDWDSLFKRIRHRNHGKVTIFYCGRPDLATVVREHCNKFNFAFKKEVF